MGNAAAWIRPDTSDMSAMRNTTPNTNQVHSYVKRYATLVAHSGQVGDATEALRVAVDYIRRPEVSTQVNGTLYLRSELPAVPNASRTQGEWLERFIDAVPKARAKELKFPGESVRLEFDERAHIYRAFVAGIPLTDADGGIMAWQKGEIQKWYSTQADMDVIKGAAAGAEMQPRIQHEAFKKRLYGEIGSLQKDDRFVMERYDHSANKALLDSRIWGKDAHRRIVQDGNQNKSLGGAYEAIPIQQSTTVMTNGGG